MKKIAAVLFGSLLAAVSLSAQPALTWTKRTTAFSSDYTITTAGLVRGKLNVIGYRSLAGGGFESRLSTTSDGLTWSAPAVLPSSGIVRSITTGSGGVAYATVEDSNASNLRRMLVSEDGASWTARSTGAGSLVSVAANNLGGIVVAVGSANGGNNIVRSADGGNAWTRIDTGRAIDLHEVVFGNNRFLAISRSGTPLSSSTGTTWSEVAVPGLPSGATFAALAAYDGRFFLLVNDSAQRPRVFVSADGATWALSGSVIDAAFPNGTIATSGDFVAIAGGTTSPGSGLVYTAALAINPGLAPGTAPVLRAWSTAAQVVDPTGPGLNFLKFLGFWITGGPNAALYTAGSVFGSPASEPVVTVQPAPQTAPLGGSATFSLTVVGSGSGLTYQWFRGSLGSPIAGATNATLTISNVTAADVGTYFAQIGYPGGVTFSQPAALVIDTRSPIPTITTQPRSQSAPVGASVVFNVEVSGTSGATFQWHFNGTPIAGANASVYIISNLSATHAGAYFVAVTNPSGITTSFAATLTVTPAPSGRLINLSVLTDIATATDEFTLGYVVGGPGTTGSKPLVIRAAGPSLGALGVPGTLSDPQLETFAGSNKTGGNDNWGGGTQLTADLAAVGAFAYTGPTSRDAAVSTSLTSRDNSVKVTGVAGATGTVIAEVYDATPSANFTATTPRLLNVSVRKALGTGLTAGFVLGGSGPTKVLIRVVGPGLAAFGVPGTVVDPQLTLFNDKSVKIGENNDWAGTAELTAAAKSVGAFDLPGANSKDAALLVTLQPGGYSVQASGVGGTTGVAIVEVYEVP